jgi:hypothetical protein
VRKYLAAIVAYAAPAAAVWTLLGAILSFLPLRGVALIPTIVYCSYYGLAETIGLRALPAPGRGWQVPQSFVRGAPRCRRLLTWGVLLGPGIATRNPYAGFGLLPLVLASLGNLKAGLAVGAAIGTAHGTARAVALVRDAHQIDAAEYLQSVLRSMHWRIADGLVLAFVAGVAIVATSIHP